MRKILQTGLLAVLFTFFVLPQGVALAETAAYTTPTQVGCVIRNTTPNPTYGVGESISFVLLLNDLPEGAHRQMAITREGEKTFYDVDPASLSLSFIPDEVGEYVFEGVFSLEGKRLPVADREPCKTTIFVDHDTTVPGVKVTRPEPQPESATSPAAPTAGDKFVGSEQPPAILPKTGISSTTLLGLLGVSLIGLGTLLKRRFA